MEVITAIEQGRVPVTLMQVKGNLDTASFQVFQSKADELIAGGARHILVDLANVPFVSSAGLRGLQYMFNRLRAENKEMSEEEMHRGIREGTYKSPHLKVINLSEQATTAFKTAGFDMFIEIFTDLETAVSAF